MLTATAVCRSALSKRTNKVKVQILKDFPMFQLFKGQVTQVKPSFMRNYLHNNNGACYILKDSDINETLLTQSIEIEASKIKMEKPLESQVRKKESVEKTQPAADPEKAKPKSILDNEITVKDVRIPGLDI